MLITAISILFRFIGFLYLLPFLLCLLFAFYRFRVTRLRAVLDCRRSVTQVAWADADERQPMIYGACRFSPFCRQINSLSPKLKKEPVSFFFLPVQQSLSICLFISLPLDWGNYLPNDRLLRKLRLDGQGDSRRFTILPRDCQRFSLSAADWIEEEGACIYPGYSIQQMTVGMR